MSESKRGGARKGTGPKVDKKSRTRATRLSCIYRSTNRKINEMSKFNETDAAIEFIKSADSRETSKEIMGSIVFFANDLGEAEFIWTEGRLPGCAAADSIAAIKENVTKNGKHEASDFFWGAAGKEWANQ